VVQKIIIICGPTAVGKTRAGIELAERAGGEIVSADSQQVWRGFDVGTAKPTPSELARVPHHLLDCVDPAEHFDAARFVAFAERAISEIAARGKVPLVVGGTGLYLRMLVRGICGAPPRDPDVRRAIEAEVAERGVSAAHARLAELDSATAAKVAPNDRARIVRALEIFELTGIPASELRLQHGFGEQRYEALWIGLAIERAELYRRIDERVDRMIAAGLPEEVAALRKRHGDGVQPFSAVGYREILAYLRGEGTLEDAVRLIKRNSRRYAKRQLTWFRAEPELRWFSPEEWDRMAQAAEAFLALPSVDTRRFSG
jgi:tRNA dimethylallyltransferase